MKQTAIKTSLNSFLIFIFLFFGFHSVVYAVETPINAYPYISIVNNGQSIQWVDWVGSTTGKRVFTGYCSDTSIQAEMGTPIVTGSGQISGVLTDPLSYGPYLITENWLSTGVKTYNIGEHCLTWTKSGINYSPDWTQEWYYLNFDITSQVIHPETPTFNIGTPLESMGIHFNSPTGTTNTPVVFSGTYTTSPLYWNNIYIYITPRDETEETIGKLIPIEPNSSGTFRLELDLKKGIYDFQARLYDSNTYTFWDWQPSETLAYTFTVEDLDDSALVCNPFSSRVETYFINSNFSMKGCFLYLFEPTESSFNQFLTLKDTIEKKAPFGYVKEIFAILGSLDESTTKEFELEQVAPITDNIFTPIKTALAWLLWFTFAFLLFKRFKDIQI